MPPKANKMMSSSKTTVILLLHSLYIISGGLQSSEAIAPTIDYSHNMRVLKLPQSTPIGSLIYRLKGSDGDANSQLVFGVSGHEARTLLDVVPVQKNWNEADVYLRSKPEKSHYNLTLFVTDGNKTTSVESTIIITDDEQFQQQQQQHYNSSTNSLLPFLNTRHVFHVPENAKANELIGSLSVLESEKSDLPVRFELRGKGAERFSINYVFGPKGQSKGELVLGQELDYEKQNLFSLKVLALNGWSDSRFDTRNVATMDIVITVGDVQDSPPVFRNLPQSIRLATDLKAGQLVHRCEAEDGDFADQRPIQYALDAGSPLASYFDINKSSGDITLTKSIAELLMNAAWQQQSMLTVFASELPDPSSYDHLWPPMYARVEIPLLLVDTLNEPPQFIGGWQTRDLGPRGQQQQQQVNTLHGYLPEWTGDNQQQQQLVVRWFTNSSGSSGESPLLEGISKSLGNRPSVLDLGLGSNGTFELTLGGADAELFHLEPSGFVVSRQTTFTLSVAEHANKSLFDHEHNNQLSHLFTVDVVARDFGQPERLSAKIRCLIELVDTNDNWPSFDTDLYSFSVYENAPIGHLLGQVRARDLDSSAGKVSYVSLSGADSQLFRLNQDTGQVTLEAHLDREKKGFYMFLVEARDSTSDHGLTNYTQMIINVLDVNDNAPVFLQSHYDAVLLSDGTFYQPLQVRAIDADEPGTANSQVAYEIIAGNLNEQFSIDSVSGVIYPVAGGGKQAQYPQAQPAQPADLPSTLKEPISPHRGSPSNGLEQVGKIRPMLEVEDSPRASRRLVAGQTSLDRQQPAKIMKPEMGMPALDVEQLPALDLLMGLESAAATSAEPRPDYLANAGRANTANNQLGPITTLVVRAHDFGIPLRSSTVKVNIFNQALLTRSVSLILNGTIEQLEAKREAIERAFSSLTGSRASIESLDALGVSSSLSVARVRLAVPEHSLVDLTDLSALMSAIEYRAPHTGQEHPSQPTFYYPSAPSSSNLSDASSAGSGGGSGSGSGGGAGNTHLGHNIFSDIHSYAIDSNAALERRLLIYIIIVGVCILALLVAWMIYYCCSRNEQNSQKLISNSSGAQAAAYRSTTAADAANKTQAKSSAAVEVANHHGVGSPIANNLAKGRQTQQQQLDDHSMSNLLVPGAMLAAADANQTTTKTTTTTLKGNNYSMYNGQVWFEPNGNSLSLRQHHSSQSPIGSAERRASSAPSGGGNSLESALHSVLAHGGAARGGATWAAGPPRQATGQFFPNSLGYARNVASIAANQPDAYTRTSGQVRRAHLRSRGKVAPMPLEQSTRGATLDKRTGQQYNMSAHSNGAFVHDEEAALEAGRVGGQQRNVRQQHRKQSSLDSTGSTASAGAHDNCSTGEHSMEEISLVEEAPAAEMSVELDSDQELLGFDSTGMPIIATHTRSATSIKPIVVERDRPIGPTSSVVSALSRSRETVAQADPPTGKQTAKVEAPAEVQTSAPTGGLAATTQRGSESPQVGDEGDNKREEAIELKTKDTSNKSIDGTNKQRSSTQTTSPLMSELTERISSRKGSSNKDVEQDSAAASAGRAASGAGEPAAGTFASNKRQLMLRQGKTTTEATKSLSGSGSDSTSDERSSTADTASISSRARELSSMKNGELLEKKSIFALTYSGLATDKPPLAD